MFTPHTPGTALLLTVLTAVFWGSWANTYKGARNYPFQLFYWDYIFGVLICSLAFALTLGSSGATGEPFAANLRLADVANVGSALLAGVIFNVANLLLVAAVDIAGLTVAFPLAIGIALVEGVATSYLVQARGDPRWLAAGVGLALLAVISNARAYAALNRARAAADTSTPPRRGLIISVVAGLLMGGFAPFMTRAMSAGHPLTPYSAVVLFSLGAVLCSLGFNTYLMKRPLHGTPVSGADFWAASPRNHLLGLLGGVAWGVGGCFNFIAAGLLGVPISYAIGQSAPLVAALWGVIVWREFAAAPRAAWIFLGLMFLLYVGAIAAISHAYGG